MNRSGRFLQIVTKNLPGTFYVFNNQGEMIEWNRKVEEISGYTHDEVKQLNPLDFFTGEDKERVREAIETAFLDGDVEIEANFFTKNREKIPFYFNASRIELEGVPHLVGIGIDISNQKKAEKEFQKLYKKEKRDSNRNEFLVNKLQLLTKVNTIFLEEVDSIQKALESVSDLVVKHLADLCSFDIIREKKLGRVVTRHRDMDKEEIAKKINNTFPELFYKSNLLKSALSEKEPVYINKVDDKIISDHTRFPPLLDLLSKLEIDGILIQPLIVKDREIGSMTLLLSGDQKKVIDEMGFLFDELAYKISLAIDSFMVKKRLEELNATLDERVQERTAQLEMANKELESFSYSVSHDLRAPLRAINGYSKLLIEDYYNELDQEGKEFLNILKDETERMGELIDDLLTFSRLSRSKKNIRHFSMKQLVEESIDEILLLTTDVEPKFKIGKLPKVRADRKLLKRVWMNLISNAIKFQKPNNQPIVTINAEEEKAKQRFVFKITDNGVGFDMKYADKLFGVFQRLHSEEEFEGTGIGLALVHRIIRRHGGETWAESSPGQGATIFFSIPTNNVES